MKIIKYGPGMKAKRWYITECRHCHTIFKASEFDVTFVEKQAAVELDHPSPYYKTTCPVCQHRARYNIKGKSTKDEPWNKISEYVDKDRVVRLLITTLGISTLDLCIEPFGLILFPTWLNEIMIIFSLLTIVIILMVLLDEIS